METRTLRKVEKMNEMIKKLAGKEVLIRVPVQYGRLSREPRKCKIVNIEKINDKYKVTLRICKGEKGNLRCDNGIRSLK